MNKQQYLLASSALAFALAGTNVAQASNCPAGYSYQCPAGVCCCFQCGGFGAEETKNYEHKAPVIRKTPATK